MKEILTRKDIAILNRDCKLADKIIKEMQEAGLTPDDMLEVIRIAKIKFSKLKQKSLPK